MVLVVLHGSKGRSRCGTSGVCRAQQHPQHSRRERGHGSSSKPGAEKHKVNQLDERSPLCICVGRLGP